MKEIETKATERPIEDETDKATQIMCEYTCAKTWDELVDDDWIAEEVHDLLSYALRSQTKHDTTIIDSPPIVRHHAVAITELTDMLRDAKANKRAAEANEEDYDAGKRDPFIDGIKGAIHRLDAMPR